MPRTTSKCVVCGKDFEYWWKGGRKRVTCDPPESVGGCWAAHKKKSMADYALAHKSRIQQQQKESVARRRALAAEEGRALHGKPEPDVETRLVVVPPRGEQAPEPCLLRPDSDFPREAFVNGCLINQFLHRSK